MDTPEPGPVVLIRVQAHADGTGLLEVHESVSDKEAAAYFTHLAGVTARGEHHQEHPRPAPGVV